MGVASSTLRDHVMPNLAVDAPTRSVILPPRDAVSKVTGDEESNLSWRQSMVSHGPVVGQLGHDGLCRTTRIGQDKPQDFLLQSLKTRLLLTPSSYPSRHGQDIARPRI